MRILNGYSYCPGLSVYPEFVVEVFSLISGDGKTVSTRYRSYLYAMPYSISITYEREENGEEGYRRTHLMNFDLRALRVPAFVVVDPGRV